MPLIVDRESAGVDSVDGEYVFLMQGPEKFIQPVSPLRYPGGKRKLAHVVHSLLKLNNATTNLMVEPFVGGGAVSISFLENTKASVAVADADPLVASFWKTVFSEEAENLIECISDTRPTVSFWKMIRDREFKDDLGRAYKCLFMNRTNFSGVMNGRAGPIGGYDQKSAYDIGCRFNAEALSARIRTLSSYSDRVNVLGCLDWRETVSLIRRKVRGNKRKNLVWYLDPPFFEKADRLYRKYFSTEDHKKLHREIDNLPGNFVLSYDDVPQARQMYCSHSGFMRINLSYNARVDKNERIVAGEMLVSNLISSLREQKSLQPMGRIFAMPKNGRASHLVLHLRNFDQEVSIQSE